jgi:hypothetical protein
VAACCANPRERQGSTPSGDEATEGEGVERQPQPLTATVSMATRRGTTPAKAGGETSRSNDL